MTKPLFNKIYNYFMVLEKTNKQINYALKAIKDADNQEKLKPKKICFAQVEDPFFLLLFSIIARQSKCRVSHFPIRGLNGAVGDNFLSKVKRSNLFRLFKNKAWSKYYSINCGDYSGSRVSRNNPKIKKRAKILLNEFRKSPDKKNFKFNGIVIGDLVIDSYLRYKPAPSLNIEDAFLSEIFYYALVNIELSQEAFGRLDPDIFCSSYTAYVDLGIPTRVALNLGIEVYTFGNMFAIGQRVEKIWPFHMKSSINYKISKDNIIHNHKRIALGSRMLSRRLKGEMDSAISYMKESVYSKKSNRFKKFE